MMLSHHIPKNEPWPMTHGMDEGAYFHCEMNQELSKRYDLARGTLAVIAF